MAIDGDLLLPDNEISTVNHSLFTNLSLCYRYLVIIWLLFGYYLVIIWLLFGYSAYDRLPVSILPANRVHILM